MNGKTDKYIKKKTLKMIMGYVGIMGYVPILHR